jgi:hypothetical protein
MRKAIAILAILMGLTLALAASAPAYADPGNGQGQGQGQGQGNGNGNSNGNGNGGGNGAGNDGSPNGANGTVKIHDWPDHKNASDMANDPKVCQFEIHGFGFDPDESSDWWIQAHKWGNGDKSKAVLSGDYDADGSGNWTEGPFTLDDGHYKLFVQMEHGTFKHKVFKVECGEVAGETATPAPTSPTPTPSPTGGAGAQATPTPSPTGTAGAQASPSPTVAGQQQPPMVGGVSPQVETAGPGAQAGAQPGAQAAPQVAGQQAAPVTGLPSTSTEAGASILAALLAGAGLLLMRRSDR